ncbi:MAG: F0F1 ATP synthase subunit alpha, partial [Gammaproteobacteria bacterium]
LMKQGQYSPLSVAEMAFVLYAANEGYLNDVPVNKVVAYEAAMLADMKSNHGDLMAQINESGDYNDDISTAMESALDNFKANGVY